MTKILIVEDDLSELLVLQAIFRDKGYEIILARDGKEGLTRMMEDPNLAIVDYLMEPYTGGFFAYKIRNDKKYKFWKNIPIIGYGSFPKTLHIRSLFNEIINKGEGYKKLEKIVEDYIRKKY